MFYTSRKQEGGTSNIFRGNTVNVLLLDLFLLDAYLSISLHRN